MRFITDPKDIALIAESLLILINLAFMVVQKVVGLVREYRGRRARAIEQAQLPAIRAAQRERDHQRFTEIAREVSYSIEESAPMSRAKA